MKGQGCENGITLYENARVIENTCVIFASPLDGAMRLCMRSSFLLLHSPKKWYECNTLWEKQLCCWIMKTSRYLSFQPTHVGNLKKKGCLLVRISLTLHCQFCRARILSNLHTVHALVFQCHLLDDQFAIAAFTADLKALGGQDDTDAFVPADATSGVGHGAVEDHTALLDGGLILQRFNDVDRKL